MSWLKWLFFSSCLAFGFNGLIAQYEILNYEFSSEGAVLPMALTGGFTSPQFSSIDFNRDGVQDMVVFDRDGNIFRSFIYDTDIDGFRYAPEYNDVFPEARNFVLIVDYNADGVEDLFTFSHLPGIAGFQVFRGREDGGSLAFEAVTFGNHRDIIEYENSSGSYTNAYVSSIDLPVVEDIDRDGDIDILSWEPSGSYIYYYRNMAVERGYSLDSLVFTLDDRCWGKVFESEFSEDLFLSDNPNSCSRGLRDDGSGSASLRHAGSTISSRDLNGDGLTDLLIGDIGSDKITALYNGGTAENAYGVDQDSNYPSSDRPLDFNRFLSPFFLDLNNDGVDEMIAAPNSRGSTRNQNFIWRYNNSLESDSQGFEPVFVQENYLEELTLDLSGYSVPAVADVNQDGLPDLLVGTQGIHISIGEIEPRMYLFLNTGTPSEPSFTLEDSDYLSLSSYPGNQNQGLAPAFGDLDGDGDMDLVVGSFSGGLFYFENLAGPNEPFAFDDPIVDYEDIDIGQFSVPQIVDVNEDGLGDLVIGERNGNSVDGMACGNINYFQNVGSPGQPAFESDEQVAPNTPCLGQVFTRSPTQFTGYSSPQLISSEDGFLLLTGSQSRQILLYGQAGSITDPMNIVEDGVGDLEIGLRTHPRFYDLNQNGFFELIVGNSRGGLEIFSTPWSVSGSTAVVGEITRKERYGVYPNPGRDHFQLTENLGDVYEVQLLSSNGLRIQSWDASQSSSFQTRDIPAGVYYILIKTPDEVLVRRWVKQ